MVIIVHAGLHKTGTSAIQQQCAANRERLAALGYLYPSSGPKGNHVGQIRKILGTHSQEGRPVEDILAEIRGFNGAAAIISSEYLSAHLQELSDEGPLTKVLLETGRRIRIFVYVRNTISYINSAYAQLAKTFRTELTFSEYVSQQTEVLASRFQAIAELLGSERVEVSVSPYDETTRKVGVATHFLGQVGLMPAEIETLGPEPRVNQIAGPIAVAVGRDTLAEIKTGGHQLTQREAGRLKRALADCMRGGVAEQRFQGIDAPLRQSIESALAERQNEFSRQVWGKDWDEVLPPEDIGACNRFEHSRADTTSLGEYGRLRAALAPFVNEILRQRGLDG